MQHSFTDEQGQPSPLGAEQHVALAVRRWLAWGGWEVYQEVEAAGGRIDIVAVRGPVRWAIEVKPTLNLVVLDQTHRNQPWFHYSSLAVPAPARHPHGSPGGWRIAQVMARQLGFGMLRVMAGADRGEDLVKQDVLPRLNRRPAAVKLYEEQKTWLEAGAAGGGYFTLFKRTARNVAGYVAANPGVSLRQAVGCVEHHYASEASATSALASAIRRGEAPGVELRNGLLYPCRPGRVLDSNQ